jgi:hypothetical protein
MPSWAHASNLWGAHSRRRTVDMQRHQSRSRGRDAQPAPHKVGQTAPRVGAIHVVRNRRSFTYQDYLSFSDQKMHIPTFNTLSRAIPLSLAVFFWGVFPASAELIVNGGSLTVNFDANALATESDFRMSSDPWMQLAQHYTAADNGVRVTTGTVRNGTPQIRKLIDVGVNIGGSTWTSDWRAIKTYLPGYTMPSSTGLTYSIYDSAPTGNGSGRFPQASNFTIDLSGNPATATGQIGIGGADSFWFTDRAYLDTYGVLGTNVNSTPTNLNLGDYSVYYDASRVTGATSGWVFSTHLNYSPGAVAFDTSADTILNATPSTFNLAGSLIVASDLSDFSGLRLGANVGTFNLTGFDVTAVPEPSSFALLGVAGVAGAVLRRRRQSKSAPVIG